MKNQFCPSCASLSFTSNDDHRFFCSKCDYVFYKNVAATASVVLVHGDDVLFSVRKNDPSEGLLDFPGGFVDPGETFEEALHREMREELDWDAAGHDFRYIFSAPNSYPYAGTIYNTADAFFLCDVNEKPLLRPMDDVAALRWSSLHAIDASELAFPSMRTAVEKLIEIRR